MNELIFLQRMQSEMAVILSMESSLAKITESVEALYAKQKYVKQMVEDAKEMFKNSMIKAGVSSLELDGNKYTVYETAGTFEIENEQEVSEEYKKTEVITKVDKKKAKKYYEETKVVPAGFTLKKNKAIRITEIKKNEMNLLEATVKAEDYEEDVVL